MKPNYIIASAISEIKAEEIEKIIASSSVQTNPSAKYVEDIKNLLHYNIINNRTREAFNILSHDIHKIVYESYEWYHVFDMIISIRRNAITILNQPEKWSNLLTKLHSTPNLKEIIEFLFQELCNQLLYLYDASSIVAEIDPFSCLESIANIINSFDGSIKLPLQSTLGSIYLKKQPYWFMMYPDRDFGQYLETEPEDLSEDIPVESEDPELVLNSQPFTPSQIQALQDYEIENHLDQTGESLSNTDFDFSKHRLLLFGDCRISETDIKGIFKRLGFSKNNIEIISDYEKITNYDLTKLQYSNRYSAILIGPVPHSIKGLGEATSLVSYLRDTPGVPKGFEIKNSSEKLKVTKSSLELSINQVKKYLLTISI